MTDDGDTPKVKHHLRNTNYVCGIIKNDTFTILLLHSLLAASVGEWLESMSSNIIQLPLRRGLDLREMLW